MVCAQHHPEMRSLTSISYGSMVEINSGVLVYWCVYVLPRYVGDYVYICIVNIRRMYI